MNGGCLCGTARYRLTQAPTDIGICHCRDCQLNSAGPAMPFANMPVDTFAITAGRDCLVEYASSAHGRRSFCGTCGTPLIATDIRDPGMLALNIVTLDTPEALRPAFHIYYDSHIAWAPACDHLPRFARSRPTA